MPAGPFDFNEGLPHTIPHIARTFRGSHLPQISLGKVHSIRNGGHAQIGGLPLRALLSSIKIHRLVAKRSFINLKQLKRPKSYFACGEWQGIRTHVFWAVGADFV